MIASFYTSAAGMLGQIEQQDVISNNLANCNTSGYKRACVGFSAFAVDMANASRAQGLGNSHKAGAVVPVAFTRQDWRQGELEQTASASNLAIDGLGEFVVRTPYGDRLTRDGNFRLDTYGQLVTSEGDVALGQNGPIRIPGDDWQIDTDGSVKVNGTVIDTLRVELPKDAPSGSQRGRVIQGRLESSNVSAIKETIGMISALRAYEANQRAIQALDQTLDKIINQAGRSA